MATALLTFSLGPVHTFIAQARRVADLWAGSTVLSSLTRTAIEHVLGRGGSMIFPTFAAGVPPDGLPNRFVCRVPLDSADAIAGSAETAVRDAWRQMVARACTDLGTVGFEGLEPDEVTLQALTCAWSWTDEFEDYADSSRKAAAQFAASRMYRPFVYTEQDGEKCAVCGERTALPDGDRRKVVQAWTDAASKVQGTPLEAFLRVDQGRLCLVCATKRLVPYAQGSKRQIYVSFTAFEPAERRPYFAIVSMDGDRLGETLGGAHLAPGSSLERYQADVSAALSAFAAALRTNSAALNQAALSLRDPLQGATPPQLIYAGGEDVLFLADPRDALSCAIAVRNRYRQEMAARGLDPSRLTISGAVLYAHTKIPAGSLFAEAEILLKEKAKRSAGRDAVALSLHKRSGEPVSVAFKWDDPLLTSLETITRKVGEKSLSSRQTYRVAEEGQPLLSILRPEQWQPWLASRLSGATEAAPETAELLTPFFQQRRVEALRIARFLALETKEQ